MIQTAAATQEAAQVKVARLFFANKGSQFARDFRKGAVTGLASAFCPPGTPIDTSNVIREHDPSDR